MKQPVKNNVLSPTSKPKKKYFKRKQFKKSSDASELDGSGLESFFRINILDKLGIKYTQQFKAESIGRFYDFYLPNHNVILEIDGDYFHKNPAIYESAINSIQKRNMRVDKLKDTWALINGYVLIRIWETDIRSNPENVMKMLADRLNIQTGVVLLAESKKNGSFYMKKD